MQKSKDGKSWLSRVLVACKTIQDMLCDTMDGRIGIICMSNNSVHLSNGIDILSDSAGVHLNVSHSHARDYYEYFFYHCGIKFYQIESERIFG